ncbi:MAG: hypothetical protein V4749_05010 [Pseudomonadota bacterium]
MERTFRNPANGHTESVGGASWLAVLIFGAFYLAYKGLWGHFFIWLLLVGGFSVLTGGPGLIIALPLASIGYAIGINSILTNSYLRKGWVEVSGDSAGAQTSDLRDCPFCAETIKCAAIKCKHCGADVEATSATKLTQNEPAKKIFNGWTVRISTQASDAPRVEQLLDDLGIPVMAFDGGTIVTGPFDSENSAKAVSIDLGDKHNLQCHMYWVPSAT